MANTSALTSPFNKPHLRLAMLDCLQGSSYRSYMRETTDANKIEQLMDAIAQKAKGPGKIYFAGGTTAVSLGFRASTKDVDLKMDPEPPGIFEALRDIKEELNINIELASPDQFIPPVPGWEERSLYIATRGSIEFYHYDPVGQALAKIERGHAQDMQDVQAMQRRGLWAVQTLRQAASAIVPQLIRYPAIDAPSFMEKVECAIEELERGS